MSNFLVQKQVWQFTGEGTRLVFIDSGYDNEEDVDMDE